MDAPSYVSLGIMADLTDQQREMNRACRMLKCERAAARDIARTHAAEDLDRRLTADPPEWFSPEQVWAYREALLHLRDRTGATTHPHSRTLKPTLAHARGRA